MSKTKTFDPDEFLFDLYAMSSTEVQKIFLKELNKAKPHLEKIEVMLESGLVDVNAKDNRGWSPLHWASANNAIEVAKLLIERGADVDAKNVDGWTPLHWASARNYIELAELLIKAGADVNSENNDGQTPLHWASWNSHIEIVKFLIEKGADVEAKDNRGITPLHLAYSDEMKVLLK